ncbi:MAG: tRNA (adenosine(37)-N6)-threonylcarbamoyltransferase complex dimerization subunit type 1 TsaB [Candidatus Dadabacteria bacterium]|nr:tRNA (adenosine(37)-N6)-threonylcarbamoyltransferase complex dimerization subunit type 1 TsaB [Candidatus Dadabacteria bacterium]
MSSVKILAIETSTYSGSIAVADGDRILGEYYMGMGPSHSEKLIPKVDMLLSELEMDKSELSGLAVTAGPGSFTSLRVGISTVKGLAFALDLPVVSASSLELLAMNAPFSEYQICPVIDARRGEVFSALFRSVDGNLARLAEDAPRTLPELRSIIKEKTIFIGEGALLYKDFLEDNHGESEPGESLFCPSYLNYPRASSLAYLGVRRLREGLSEDAALLSPAYLRKPDAELSAKGRDHDRI